MAKQLQITFLIYFVFVLTNMRKQAQIVEPDLSSGSENKSDTTKKDSTSISSIVRKQDTNKVYTNKDVKIYNIQSLQSGALTYKILSTKPTAFKNYNLLYNENYYNLGAYGKAAGPLINKFISNKFELKQDVLGIYHYKQNNISFYKTYVPYSLMSAIFNGSHEQIFNIIHTRNIRPNWNIGIDLKSQLGKGYYASNTILATKNFNLSIWNWYQSPNANYNLYSALIINKDIVPESGGLLDDNILTDNSETQPDFQKVYLLTARNERKILQLFFNQSYKFTSNKATQNISTNQKQNIKNKQKPSLFILPQLDYNFSYTTDKNIYIDKNNTPKTNYNFYSHYFFNDKYTEDAINFSTVKNSVNLKLSTNNYKIIDGAIQFGLEHSVTNYEQSSQNSQNKVIVLIDTTINTISINSKAKLNLNNYIALTIHPSYVLAGYNKKDAQITLNFEIPKIIPNTSIIYNTKSYEPAFVFQNYQSNHHSWNNSFNKIHINSFLLNYKNLKILDISLNGFLIHNFVYLKQVDKHILPVQNTNIQSLLQLEINKEFNLGKYIKLNSSLILQKVPEEIILSPKIFTKHSLYYYNTFFTNLYVETGVDLSYFKLEKLYAYSPELNLFYISQDTINNSRPLLTTDLFISGNLGKANFFAKYALINELLGYPKGFYTVNKYIMPYPSLSLGVSWRFYD